MGWFRSKDEEKRKLRCHLFTLKKANEDQKVKRQIIEKENRELRKELKEIKEAYKKLEGEKEEIRKQRDRFRNMLFKSNVKPKKQEEEIRVEDDLCKMRGKKNKRGAQPGHCGKSREKPDRIDKRERIYLSNCLACGKKLKRSKKIHTHTIEDIPSLEKIKTEITCYEIEEQWCCCCKKHVRAYPAGIIPGSRLGINILIFALMQKYGAKSSWPAIVFNLAAYFNVQVSEGSLISMMHRAQRWLGPWYDSILEEIRGSPVKHADETNWRIDGINHWLWGFFTEKQAYYTVEESRGGGVAKDYLAGSDKEDVLVRDDYGGYKNLALRHQSCWAHLLRTSKEAAVDPDASGEVKELHKYLHKLYEELSSDVAMPFNDKGRSKLYDLYSIKISDIIQAKYKHNDTKGIQTRIANQDTNLITALKYKNVPLTNNLAERCIRPFVIVRKMSGGSRSCQGAKTQAVNMSIFQTIKMQNLPIISTLKENLLKGCNPN